MHTIIKINIKTYPMNGSEVTTRVNKIVMINTRVVKIMAQSSKKDRQHFNWRQDSVDLRRERERERER